MNDWFSRSRLSSVWGISLLLMTVACFCIFVMFAFYEASQDALALPLCVILGITVVWFLVGLVFVVIPDLRDEWRKDEL